MPVAKKAPPWRGVTLAAESGTAELYDVVCGARTVKAAQQAGGQKRPRTGKEAVDASVATTGARAADDDGESRRVRSLVQAIEDRAASAHNGDHKDQVLQVSSGFSEKKNYEGIVRKRSPGDLFIRGLPKEVTTERLKAELIKSGAVALSARVIVNERGQSSRFGFATMATKDDALVAIDALSGKDGWEVKLADPPKKKHDEEHTQGPE